MGAVNPNVTQDNIRETICVSGWTKTVRPPTGYTNQLKKLQIKAAKLPGPVTDYEEDHYIPLTLGGHPYSTHNLWLQRWYNGECGAHIKDRDEVAYNHKVCSGEMTLNAAQLEFSKKWEHCYRASWGKTKR